MRYSFYQLPFLTSYCDSDHAPVSAVFKLNVDIVNQSQLESMLNKSLRQVDIEERESHPTCEIKPPTLHFGTIVPLHFINTSGKGNVLSSFTLTNSGRVNAHFLFKQFSSALSSDDPALSYPSNSLKDSTSSMKKIDNFEDETGINDNDTIDSACLPPWLYVDPFEGNIVCARNSNRLRSNVVKFNFSLNMEVRSLNFMRLYQSAVSFMKTTKTKTSNKDSNGKEYNVDELILLHIRNGADYIIRIFAMYEPSCIGIPLEELQKIKRPIRYSLINDSVESENNNRNESFFCDLLIEHDQFASQLSSKRVPKEIIVLLDALVKVSESKESDSLKLDILFGECKVESISITDYKKRYKFYDNGIEDLHPDIDEALFFLSSPSGGGHVLDRVDRGVEIVVQDGNINDYHDNLINIEFEGEEQTPSEKDKTIGTTFVDVFSALVILFKMLPEPILCLTATQMCNLHVPESEEGIAMLVKESATDIEWETMAAVANTIRKICILKDDEFGYLSATSILLRSLSHVWFHDSEDDQWMQEYGVEEEERRCLFLRRLFGWFWRLEKKREGKMKQTKKEEEVEEEALTRINENISGAQPVQEDDESEISATNDPNLDTPFHTMLDNDTPEKVTKRRDTLDLTVANDTEWNNNMDSLI